MHKTKPVLKADAKYKSLYGASVSIAREEGVRALWKGHVSGQCLSVILASVQFGLYQALWQRAAANGEFCLLFLYASEHFRVNIPKCISSKNYF